MPWITTPETEALIKKIGEWRQKVRHNGISYNATIKTLKRIAGILASSSIEGKMQELSISDSTPAAFFAEGSKEFHLKLAKYCGMNAEQTEKWISACWELQVLKATTDQIEPMRISPPPFPYKRLVIEMNKDASAMETFLTGNCPKSLRSSLDALEELSAKGQISEAFDLISKILKESQQWIVDYLTLLSERTKAYIKENDGPQNQRLMKALGRDLRQVPMLFSMIRDAVGFADKSEWVKTDEVTMLGMLINDIQRRKQIFTNIVLPKPAMEVENPSYDMRFRRDVSQYQWGYQYDIVNAFTSKGFKKRRSHDPTEHAQYMELARGRFQKILAGDAKITRHQFDLSITEEIVGCIMTAVEHEFAMSYIQSFHICIGRPFYVATAESPVESALCQAKATTATIVRSVEEGVGVGGWCSGDVSSQKSIPVSKMLCSTETKKPEFSAENLTVDQRKKIEDAWLHQASGEHASIASFAHHTLELLKYEAPPELLEAAMKAGQDEIRHAKLCFRLASQYARDCKESPNKVSYRPGPLAVADHSAMAVASSLQNMACRIMRDGCFGETVSVLVAARQLEMARAPNVKSALRTIINDETQHAALAWRSVYWCIRKNHTSERKENRSAILKALTKTFKQEMERLRPSVDHESHGSDQKACGHVGDDDVLRAHGVIQAEDVMDVTKSVTIPLLNCLLKGMQAALEEAAAKNADDLPSTAWNPETIIASAIKEMMNMRCC